MQQACRLESDLRRDMMQIEAESGPIPMALVQNKVDLMDQVGTLAHWHLLLARHCNLRACWWQGTASES